MTPWAEIDDSDHSVRANMCALLGNVRPATNRDEQLAAAKETFENVDPSKEQIEDTRRDLVEEAKLHFDDSKFRQTLTEISKNNTQYIDPIADELLDIEAEPNSMSFLTNH
jgi:DNA-dependent RNA polymerase auxiliary subunit epsilon